MQTTTANDRERYRRPLDAAALELSQPRDPRDEARRLLRTPLEDLSAIRHHCFAGRRDFTAGFRALVVSGGVGDAAIYLAKQLRRVDATVVYLDDRAAAHEIARARAAARGLEQRIRWTLGGVRALAATEREPFDYIALPNARLAETDDPLLSTLVAWLKPDGAMGISTAARAGARGWEQARQLLALLTDRDEDPATRLSTARALLADLPVTNWLRRTTRGALPWTDAALYDRLLAPHALGLEINELHARLAQAGLRLVEFAPASRPLYDRGSTFRTPRLAQGTARLGRAAQHLAAESMWMAATRYDVWAARETARSADPTVADNVPELSHWPEFAGLRESIATCRETLWSFKAERPDGVALEFHLDLNPGVRRVVELIDGQRTIGGLVGQLLDERLAPTPEAAGDAWLAAYAFLAQYDLVLLRHKTTPSLRLAAQD